MADGDGDFLYCLFSDAGNLFELLGGHVGERFDGGDPGSDKFLEDGIAELGDLFDRRGGAAGHGLHLLFDLLALLLFALDVDLPLEELGSEANVLSLLADGKRELGIVDDDFNLLFA